MNLRAIEPQGNSDGLRSQSLGLAIDTSSPILTLALGSVEGVYRDQTWNLDREISAQLHPLLREFIAPQRWTDLAWILVLKGPGSFTGTRIGLVTARTLAQQLKVPLFGVSNLAIAAWREAIKLEIRDRWTVAVSQPGRLGYTYGAVYEVCQQAGTLTALMPDQLVTLEAWNQTLAEVGRSIAGRSIPGRSIQMHLKLDTHTSNSLENPTAPDLQPSLGTTLLGFGWQQWQQGFRPEWYEALPYYG
ncbi:MAG: tRNA (adenosine(37)-N6)-threonylcarbamoyltransferase complex dimerization subunit type 1 TsaB [Thermosynechococcaceae cyanobacterium MS004]|nr:tRNA (adenosine(37)-N6)-threonylcarbamoyltransferase complex dimerization subunit type 1 TsaB [Thermosynechococcaceae cyanobacterium MS004]